MNTIKAIETRYKGYRFRSRLEARWAVFFDALGVAWEYEKEGFDLGEDGWYLPDFWVPSWRLWVEIKPSEPERGCLVKPTGFAWREGGERVLVVFGNPWVGEYRLELFEPPGQVNWYDEFAACRCGRPVLIGDGHQRNLECEGEGWAESGSLLRAHEAARSARFEFGESGARG